MLCKVTQPICECTRLVAASHLKIYCVNGNGKNPSSCSFFNERKMEQTLQIAINENVKTTAIAHLGMNKGVLKLKVIYRQASFYLERETNNNQNDFIDIIFF